MVLQIAHNLSDQDLANFCQTCSKVNNHINATGCSFFRHRFLQEFDYPNIALMSFGSQLAHNGQFYHEYITRRAVLNVIDAAFQAQGAKPMLSFHKGKSDNEVVALGVVRDLIIEAFGARGSPSQRRVSKSKNLELLNSFLDKTNLLQIIGRDSTSDKRLFATAPHSRIEALYAIQCALAPALFALNKRWSDGLTGGFPDAQSMAYADNITAPVVFGVSGLDVNMQWVLRNLQFWHQHLTRKNEVLAEAFEALDESDRPSFHTKTIADVPGPLGSFWKGSYAFLDRGAEINSVRNGKSWKEPIMDKLNGEGDPDSPFQDLILHFPSPDSAGAWPRVFERILSSLKTPVNRSRTRAQLRSSDIYQRANFAEDSIRLQGSGHDSSDDFNADGWLNPLPEQHGIPGWQRMTMMKFFIEKNGNVDMDSLWAYEGIVLPGGKIMVGRWWCPSDGEGEDMYSGPFILWNVPEAPKSFDAKEGKDGSDDDDDDE